MRGVVVAAAAAAAAAADAARGAAGRETAARPTRAREGVKDEAGIKAEGAMVEEERIGAPQVIGNRGVTALTGGVDRRMTRGRGCASNRTAAPASCRPPRRWGIPKGSRSRKPRHYMQF